jgi:dihydroorotase (multifunctional complex type)
VDLIIKNAKIFVQDRVIESCLAINDGKIVAIGVESKMPRSDSVLKGNGKLVIPGLIDVHVHFRDPGFTHKEDFKTGTAAAAAGGVTTIIDEPNNIPPTYDITALKEKMKIAEKKAVIDYSFSYGLNTNNLDDIEQVHSMGISSFDIFTGGFSDQLSIKNPGIILEALSKVKEIGAITCLTCGDSMLNNYTTEKMKNKGRRDINAYSEASLTVSEGLGVARNLLLANSISSKLHLRQITNRNALNVLKKLKNNNKVTSEVSPFYLFLNTKNIEKLGPFGKVGPSIKPKKEMEATWFAFVNGEIDIIATDHAPHTREEKEQGKEDIWKAPPGLPCIESMLPLLLTQVNKGRIGIKRIIEATSELPAKIFGLYPKKGTIQIGSDADLTLVDLNAKGIIEGKSSHSKIDWTPFEGFRFLGRPVTTLVRGVKVFDDFDIIGSPGYGKFVPSMNIR